ncbi:Adaptor protein complex 4 (AP-4); mu subunit [Paratrimastix pyriformis]|uniref:Adaptor protein complex 4 (AP-4) n=1 Tax=Paratrimastix pyriformis TaxID=342808 RepID=A0ABQ8UJF9_9EUKA|nr:Adaptor protein complex 4 (AP-4); mu subunit [Paratrimastix pyriformis]
MSCVQAAGLPSDSWRSSPLLPLTSAAPFPHQILSMERYLLNGLRFDLSTVTPRNFLKRFLKAASADSRVAFLAYFLAEITLQYIKFLKSPFVTRTHTATFICAQFLAEITLQYIEFLKYPPSVIAASAVVLALYTMHWTVWTPTMERYFAHTLDELRPCIAELHRAYLTLAQTNLQAISTKYSRSDAFRDELPDDSTEGDDEYDDEKGSRPGDDDHDAFTHGTRSRSGTGDEGPQHQSPPRRRPTPTSQTAEEKTVVVVVEGEDPLLEARTTTPSKPPGLDGPSRAVPAPGSVVVEAVATALWRRRAPVCVGEPVPRFQEQLAPLLLEALPAHPVQAAVDCPPAGHPALLAHPMQAADCPPALPAYPADCNPAGHPALVARPVQAAVDCPPAKHPALVAHPVHAADCNPRDQECNPDQTIIYVRDTSRLDEAALVPSRGSILVLDQEEPSRFREICTLASKHHLRVLLATTTTTSAGAQIANRASAQLQIVTFHYALDVGLEPFVSYLRRFPTCLSRDDLRALHAFLGGSICAAMLLLGQRKLLQDSTPGEDGRGPEGNVPIPRVLAPFPLAGPVLAFLVGLMTPQLARTPYFFNLAGLFCRGDDDDDDEEEEEAAADPAYDDEDSYIIRMDESTDLRWFLPISESEYKIASPLYRRALSLACQLAPPLPFDANLGTCRSPCCPPALGRHRTFLPPLSSLHETLSAFARSCVISFIPTDWKHPDVDQIRVILLETQFRPSPTAPAVRLLFNFIGSATLPPELPTDPTLYATLMQLGVSVFGCNQDELSECLRHNQRWMSISQLFILSQKGDAIVSRDYRGDVPRTSLDVFFRKIMSSRGDLPPIFAADGVIFAYVKRGGLYVVTTTRFNASPFFLIEFLSRLMRICKDFCGVLTEESVRKNFVLIYELLDEILDFGYVQSTSTQLIKPFIHNEPVLIESQSPVFGAGLANVVKFASGTKTQPSTAANKPVVSDMNRNEIYVDLLERINCVFGRNGEIINSEVDGFIQMKSFLVGNPELKLGLNEDLVVGRANVTPGSTPSLVLDDCNFHECVKLEEFERERVLSLNPPIGEFTVMNYRIMECDGRPRDFRIPFRVVAFVDTVSTHKFEVLVKVRAEIPAERYAGNVFVRIPVPQCSTGVTCELAPTAQAQTTEYKSAEKAVTWLIKRFNGCNEWQLLIRITTDQAITPYVRRQLGPVRSVAVRCRALSQLLV